MSICKIGETKVINGKRYRKEEATSVCAHCSFRTQRGGCDNDSNRIDLPIEDGGSECEGTIWILADDHPEAPTATPQRDEVREQRPTATPPRDEVREQRPTAAPPRDEVREQRRFQAAVAAMQGYCAHIHIASEDMAKVAKYAVEQADSLLAELDRTGAGK